MTPPINIGGDTVDAITIDGTDVSEVTVDGSTVFGNVIPDAGDLRARYDATQLSKSDGQSVSTWADATGNGNDLTAGTAPAYRTGKINGEPVVRFDGSDDYLDVSWSQISAPFHVFLVGTDLTGLNSAQTYFYDGTAAFEAAFFGDNSGANNTWTIFAGSRLQGGTEDATPHIWSMYWDGGGSSTIRLDGSQIASGGTGTPVLNGFTTGAIGDQSKYGNVDIGEVLVYPSDKRSIESDVESFLSDKWGVTI